MRMRLVPMASTELKISLLVDQLSCTHIMVMNAYTVNVDECINGEVQVAFDNCSQDRIEKQHLRYLQVDALTTMHACVIHNDSYHLDLVRRYLSSANTNMAKTMNDTV